ncbi:unnamed protein product [Cunninghamella blakesleeana]
MSTSSPKTSTSLPLASRDSSSNVVLPTPSSSTTVRANSPTAAPSTKLVELEHQLAEKEKQLQECSGGIEKNVLTRQIRQIKDKIQQLNDTKQQRSSSPSSNMLPSNIGASSSFYTSPQQQPSMSTSTGSVTSTGTSNSSSDQDQLAPETMERLRFLERDLNTYRSSLVPGVSRKEKLLNQRSNALNPLPSPSSSSMQESSSSSLLPLPPPLAGSTPTKRRSKVPNNDRRNTDIEFATEIGQGLLLEVRKMQTLLQEKEEQLRNLQIQKADLERAAEALTKLLRQKDEAEEQLKEETWNLELAKQELQMTVTELQQHLSKANTEQNKLHKQLSDVTSELEQVRAREDKLTTAIETLKTRHEQDMATVRRHMATMQREKAEQTKQMELLSSELAIAKAQTRIAKKSHQDLSEMNSNGNLHPNQKGSSNDNNLSKNGDAFDENNNSNDSSNKSVTLSPSSSMTTSARQQAMEVETLKTSLSHAHRMISTLRSNLHNEKKEKMDLRKLLLESQETVEQYQNDPRMWEDATPNNNSSNHHGLTPSNSSSAHPDHSTSTGSRRPRRARRRSRARISTGLGNANRSNQLKDIQNATTDHSQLQRSINKRRKTQVTFDDEDEDENIQSTDGSSYTSDDEEDEEDEEDSEDDSEEDSEDDDSDEDSEEDEDEDIEMHNNREKQQPLPGGFTSLSMELSRSQSNSSNNNSPPKGSILSSLSGFGNKSSSAAATAGPMSLSMELSKHLSKQQPDIEPSKSTSSEHAKVNRSIGDELSLTDAFRKAKNNKNGSGDNDANNNADLQELLKAAEFSEAGSSFMDKITQALDRRGVDMNTQTDNVVVLLPGTMKDSPMQTDEVIVSLPKESIDMNLQTDEVVVSLPKESVEVNLQTDDVVVSLPKDSVEVNLQTDEVVVSLPKDYVEVNLQTDEVVVSLPKDYVEVNLQTDEVVVSLPKESVEVNLQTDDVVVSLPKESIDMELQTDAFDVKEIDIQTDEVVVSLPKTYVDMELQTDAFDVKEIDVQTEDVVVSLPKEINHIEMQTEDVVVSLPKESIDMELQTDPYDVKEMDIQTDEVVVSLPKESTHMDIQTEDVVVTLPVEKSEMEIQTDPEPIRESVDKEIQSNLFTPVEVFTQTTPTAGIDQMAQVAQTDLVKTCDTTTQYDIVSSFVDQSTQSEQVPQSDIGVQSILPVSNEIGIQTSFDEENDHHALLAVGNRGITANSAEEETPATSQQQNNTNTIGGIAAVIGGIASGLIAKKLHDDKVEDSKNNTVSEEPETTGTRSIPVQSTKVEEAKEGDKKAKENTTKDADADVNNEQQLANIEPPKDEKLHSQKEVDDMIAAAVAKALEKQKNEYNNQLPTPTSPTDKAGFIHGVTLEDNNTNDNENDKRHTCDMSNNLNHQQKPKNDNGVTVTRDSSDSKRSILTDRTITTKSSTLSEAPSRPMTPPPASLLAKTGALNHYADSYNKGKGPMQTNGSILTTSTSPGQYGLSYNNDNQQRDSSLNTISQPTLASSVEPTISLISETMMGHWLWKDPRHKRLIKSSNNDAPSHQRFFWMHPYTRTLYWSTQAPGSSNKDIKTKSAYIEDMNVVPNHNQIDLPKVSINVSTSEGDMRLTAPDMDTHKTWVESLSYVLSRQPDVNGSIRMIKPNYPSISSRRSRASILSGLFNNSTASHKRYTLNDLATGHTHHHGHDHDEYDDDERLEDLRDCCNGKHHLSHLERDFIKKRPRYPKKSYRHTMMT